MTSEELFLAVVVAYAQKVLGHAFDESLSRKASTAMAELSAQINTVEALRDSKASRATEMISKLDMIQKLMLLMESNDLTPDAVPSIALT